MTPRRGPRAARLDHRRLRERPRTPPPAGDALELRHVDGLLRPQRARGQHDHLLLRHRLRPGAPARPQDPRGLEGPRVARRRHADALSDLLQGEEARLHRTGSSATSASARPAFRSTRSSTSTPRPSRSGTTRSTSAMPAWSIDLEPRPGADPWFGASTQDQNGERGHLDGRAGFPRLSRRPQRPGRDPGRRRDARHPAVALGDDQRPQARRSDPRSSTPGAARWAKPRSRWAGRWEPTYRITPLRGPPRPGKKPSWTPG